MYILYGNGDPLESMSNERPYFEKLKAAEKNIESLRTVMKTTSTTSFCSKDLLVLFRAFKAFLYFVLLRSIHEAPTEGEERINIINNVRRFVEPKEGQVDTTIEEDTLLREAVLGILDEIPAA